MTEKKPSSKASSLAIKIMVVISVIIAVISVYLLFAYPIPNKPLVGQGGAPTGEAMIGGDFVLVDQDNNKFSSDQLKGKYSLIYFGFTFCPDICPTSLNKLSKVLKTLDKYGIDDIVPVFITVDPKRDTSALLKQYLGHFSNKFIGLTGTESEIKEVADLYKVYYKTLENEEKKENYMFDHSAFVYLMDQNAKYMKHFTMLDSADDIIEFIRLNCRY